MCIDDAVEAKLQSVESRGTANETSLSAYTSDRFYTNCNANEEPASIYNAIHDRAERVDQEAGCKWLIVGEAGLSFA